MKALTEASAVSDEVNGFGSERQLRVVEKLLPKGAAAALRARAPAPSVAPLMQLGSSAEPRDDDGLLHSRLATNVKGLHSSSVAPAGEVLRSPLHLLCASVSALELQALVAQCEAVAKERDVSKLPQLQLGRELESFKAEVEGLKAHVAEHHSAEFGAMEAQLTELKVTCDVCMRMMLVVSLATC